MSKSQQIRDYMAAHPEAMSRDVAEAVGVTPKFVSAIVAQDKKRGIHKSNGKLPYVATAEEIISIASKHVAALRTQRAELDAQIAKWQKIAALGEP